MRRSTIAGRVLHLVEMLGDSKVKEGLGCDSGTIQGLISGRHVPRPDDFRRISELERELRQESTDRGVR